mgnify:CR=1 FL=1|jgi:hypothetical protein
MSHVVGDAVRAWPGFRYVTAAFILILFILLILVLHL